MSYSFLFQHEQFNRLFPFYMLIDREMFLISSGNSVQKLCGIKNGILFHQVFSIPRPYTPLSDFEGLKSLQDQLVVLETLAMNKKIKLRGQFEYLGNTDHILFVGTPWFSSMEEVKEGQMVIHDFAHHDPLIDLLHVLKAQEITTEDLKNLVSTINQQKNTLKSISKEFQEIALFPTQSPDPIICIDFKGEVLRNNPAASSLDFFEYNNSILRNDIFFKQIALQIDPNCNKWEIDARSDNKDFSFMCVPMIREGYINIYGRDITQQKKYRRELERLSMVASANDNGVLFTNLAGNITWANEGFCKMTGFTSEEVIGKTPVQLCQGPLTDPASVRSVLDAFYKGEGFSTQLVFYRKDQSSFWGRTVTQPIKDKDGHIMEFFGIIEDVTDEIANEEKLKVLSQIAEDNINAVVIADAAGKITWVNRSFVEMTGYTLEESQGKKPGHLLQGPETDQNTVHYLRNQIAKGEPFNAEILNYSKLGTKYWLRLQGQPIKNESGKVTGFFALEEDITREKETETRFKKALEHIGDNVWEHDYKTGITYFSKSENELLGRDTNDYNHNVDLWWNNVDPKDRPLLEENDKKYKKGLIDSHSLEYRVRHSNGSYRWVLDRGVVIEKNREGIPLRIIGTHTDITNIKNTETELSNRVKQFQSLSENIPGVIYEYEFRPDGTDGIRYISPAIERIFGIRIEEFKNYLEYIHPEDRESIIQKNAHCKKTLEPFYGEARLNIPGQPIRWHSVHSSFSYQTTEGNNVFTGFMLDITERKNAEQKLEEQRKFYEGILNNMPADIAVFNVHHEYLYVNPKAIKDDHIRSWIIGKRDEDYCRYRNKPLSLASGRRAHFKMVMESHKPTEWEEQNALPNGDFEYMLRRWYPVMDANGNIQLVIGYGIDITERKKSEEALRANEEKYRSIIANMNLGLMEMDANGKIIFANQTLLNMADLKEDQYVGFNPIVWIDEDYRPEVLAKMANRAKGTSEAYEARTNIHNKKGWWLVSSAPKYSRNGNFIGSIIVCLDINNQKQLENELIKSREQAVLLAKAKEMFLANMSHEIRTPMNAILGMGNQLAKTKLNDQQSFFLNTINSAADNLLVIINDILDLSKIEAGKLSIEKIAFEPRKIVQNAMQVVMHKAEEKGLKLTNSFFDSRLSPVLIGDPYRINQVLLNLLSNAIKFTERGSVDIAIEVIEDEQNFQTLITTITDTGIGMEQKFVERLFDKFSQEYESVSRKYGGTGLGMSICNELIHLMGGEISVDSVKGKGTKISFSINLRKGSPKDVLDPITEAIDGNFLQGKKILVTDDNDMNRLVASTILLNYGAVLMEANNGEEAVQIVENEPIDLVLMDIQMPVLNGYDATKAIRKFNSGLPILALTANAIRGEQDKCLAAGMNDYIIKPFKEEDFLKRIAYWLNHPLPLAVTEPNKSFLIPNEILYNLSALNEISRGNKAFVKKMITLFCNQAPDLVIQIKDAVQSGDWPRMGAVAHKLKPSIDNLGIEKLKLLIREIEKAGKDNNFTLNLHDKIKILENVISDVIGQLKNEFEF